jgi:hypothetical protein
MKPFYPPNLSLILSFIVGSVLVSSITRPASGEEEVPLFRSAFPLDCLRSVSPGDAKISAEILIRKIVEENGYAHETEIPLDHSRFLKGLYANQYDFFLMFGYEYLSHRDGYPMKPNLVGVRGSLERGPLNKFLLLTTVEKSFEDCRDGILLIERGSGELPTIWLEEEMHGRGLTNPESYFKAIEESKGAAQTVLPVFFGKADACLVSAEAFETMVELNPQLEHRLSLVAESEPLLTSVMCVREGFVEDQPGRIVNVASTLHERPDGSQILTLMGVERLVPFESDYLDSLSRLLERREKRLGTDPSDPESKAPLTSEFKVGETETISSE